VDEPDGTADLVRVSSGSLPTTPPAAPAHDRTGRNGRDGARVIRLALAGPVGGRPAAPRTRTPYPAAVGPRPSTGDRPERSAARPGGEGLRTEDRWPLPLLLVTPGRSTRQRWCRDETWSEQPLVRGVAGSIRAALPSGAPASGRHGRPNRSKRSTRRAFHPARSRPRPQERPPTTEPDETDEMARVSSGSLSPARSAGDRPRPGPGRPTQPPSDPARAPATAPSGAPRGRPGRSATTPAGAERHDAGRGGAPRRRPGRSATKPAGAKRAHAGPNPSAPTPPTRTRPRRSRTAPGRAAGPRAPRRPARRCPSG